MSSWTNYKGLFCSFVLICKTKLDFPVKLIMKAVPDKAVLCSVRLVCVCVCVCVCVLLRLLLFPLQCGALLAAVSLPDAE